MKYKAIHQFHSGAASGDAVTNAMFFTQGLLQGLGFQSRIYAEHIPQELSGKIDPFQKYRPRPDQALMVHHSMGHDRTDWILANPEPKLLVYHNITPAKYFSEESCFRRYSEIGRKQLELFRPVMKTAICDSEFNAQELRHLGYEQPLVIPLLLDVEEIGTAPWTTSIPQTQGNLFTMLFVGRIAPNKCQHHVIEVFRHVQGMLDRPAQLIFIGDFQAAGDYYPSLEQEADLSRSIHFLGKVSPEDLYGWYRAADVFVCMSEHEGFGVPLIEAMAFNVPVIAYKSSGVAQTLDGAGLLVGEKRFPEIAALIKLLAEDRALRRAVIRRQRERVHDFHRSKITSQLVQALRQTGIDVPSPLQPSQCGMRSPEYGMQSGSASRFQIEGPFDSSYSLAIVNRELALALEKISPGNVSLFATEGPGDYQPDIGQIGKIPGLKPIFLRGRRNPGADVLIRNLYPPRVDDMDGLINLLYFAWEESALPADWVQAFNRHLDGLTVLSRFVKKVLIDAGVHVPIEVAGCGIDQLSRVSRQKYRGYLGKGFRFLHISSAFPRKGIDVLLEAYTREFTSRDLVTLVIKTFPNLHNQADELIRKCRDRIADCPEIILINEDLPGEMLHDLYRQCHAFVAPSRGEGFGLPLAEAMEVGIPVITTGAGGQMDFCTEETSWLIDYQWQAARTHMGLSDSVWAEPDVGELSRVMREVFESPREKYQQKLAKAKALVRSDFTWNRCAGRVIEAVRQIDGQRPLTREKIKLGWVTSWNTPSKTFAYAKSWINHLSPDNYELKILASTRDRLLGPDCENVTRCWGAKGSSDLVELEKTIAREAFDLVVIQFQSPLFSVSTLGRLIDWLHSQRIASVIFLDPMRDRNQPAGESLASIRRELALAQRLLVSCINDLNHLKELGLVDNVTLIPSGVPAHPERDAGLARARLGIRGGPVVATFGFLRPHKGALELIQAFPHVLELNPRATLLLANALSSVPDSLGLPSQCRALIDSLGIQDHVRMVNDFLEDDEALALLESADLLVFPYQRNIHSEGGAVGFGLASHRPAAVTPLDIFHDANKLCHVLPGTTPRAIADGINRLVRRPALLESKKLICQEWIETRSWRVLGRRLDGMIRALAREARIEKSAGVENVSSQSWGRERLEKAG
jgi:glycosyltransferase involved in cell wall biosynthesis